MGIQAVQLPLAREVAVHEGRQVAVLEEGVKQLRCWALIVRDVPFIAANVLGAVQGVRVKPGGFTRAVKELRVHRGAGWGRGRRWQCSSCRLRFHSCRGRAGRVNADRQGESLNKRCGVTAQDPCGPEQRVCPLLIQEVLKVGCGFNPIPCP